MIKEVKQCPICGSLNFKETFNMIKYPLTELFVTPSIEKDFELTHHDQSFLFCKDCCHGFLKYQISPEYLYSNGNYHTSTAKSSGSRMCIDNFASFIEYQYCNHSYTLDVGGNDSLLLEKIRCEKGMIIDPNAKVNSAKYEVCSGFFEDINASILGTKELVSIVSSHTLEHIQDPHKMFEFAATASNIEDIFLQFPSIEAMIGTNRYDLVHHQHLHYYSKTSISKIASIYNFQLCRYEYDYNHYGTLRVHLKKNQHYSLKVEHATKDLIEPEEITQNYKYFKEHCSAGSKVLEQIKDIYCYGASLMLPIAFYYYPILKDSNAILDADISKTNYQYYGINTPIEYDKNRHIENLNICITAVATRNAHRAIIKQMINRNAKTIFSPFSML